MSNRSFFFYCCFLVLAGLAASAQAASLTLSVAKDWVPEQANHAIVKVTLPSDAVDNSAVTFTLRATNWPGYCMNGYFGALTNSQNGAFDMSFIQQNQTATTSGTQQ